MIKEEHPMKVRRIGKAAALSLAAAMAVQAPLTAFAVTPRFGRTEEEWARLQDDVLEYEEIEDLIHEYNGTVQNNAQLWNRDDKGKTAEDFADWYMQAADEYYAAAAEAEEELSMIGLEMQGRQAEQSAQSAADEASDGETKRFSYELTEKKLVQQAQTAMNSWYQKQNQLAAAQKNRELLEAAVASAQSRQSMGSATYADVLNAQQALQNADAQLAALQSDIENIRLGLIVMLGWKKDAVPEIRPMPKADQGRIAAMDVAADTQKACDNDYTLRITQRKLDNSASDSSRKIYTQTLQDERQKIAVAVESAYQAVQQAKQSYDQAVLALDIANKNWVTAETKYALGTISRMEHIQTQAALVSAQSGMETAVLAVFLAMDS